MNDEDILTNGYSREPEYPSGLHTAPWAVTTLFKKWANPGLFFRLFSVFSNKHYNVKNVHPVYGAGIWTHDLCNMSLFP